MVQEAGDGLRAGTTSARVFDFVTKASGQNYNLYGWIIDVQLRRVIDPLDALTQDWVHGYLCKAVLCKDACLFIERSKDPSNETVTTMADFNQLLDSDDLVFPHHMEAKGNHRATIGNLRTPIRTHETTIGKHGKLFDEVRKSSGNFGITGC